MELKTKISCLLRQTKVRKITVASLSVILILSINNVSKELTDEDIKSLESLPWKHKTNEKSFQHQIETIKHVQSLVFSIVEFSEAGVPIGAERRVSDIVNAGKGLCYDRSWLIEKILNANKFRTRHVFVLENLNDSFFLSITSLRARSHAVTEVETVKGWLIVDSIDQWISLDDSGNPVDFSELSEKIKTLKRVPECFKTDYFYIYGLYSRSGMMFKPFLPVPDFNICELFYNRN